MSDFLIEIRYEELPPSYIKIFSSHMMTQLEKKISDENVKRGQIKLMHTCSRLALKGSGFPEKQPDTEKTIFGPPEHIATDEKGNLTKAGESFCRQNGLNSSECSFVEKGKKGRVISGVKKTEGKYLEDILFEFLQESLLSVPFPRTMRWSNHEMFFARPLKNILLFVNDKPVMKKIQHITFSELSRGHRFLSPEAFRPVTDEYEDELEKRKVIVNHKQRKEFIRNKIMDISNNLGASGCIDEELLEDVTSMTEYPHVIKGSIPESYMTLPPELVTKVLKKDQRYFSLLNSDQKTLKPNFISILNTVPEDENLVVKGNEKVVNARLSDAEFYYRDDLDSDFKKYTEKLREVTYHKKLGSYFQKTVRIRSLAKYIAKKYFNLTKEEKSELENAAMLLKNDLLTGVVSEFPDLQGIMGRYYALNSGIPETTAIAIEDHYRPAFKDDKLPRNKTGTILSIAEKTDTIVGGFMAGMKPTGSKDKFAIRRNALGMLETARTMSGLNIIEIIKKASELIKKDNGSLKNMDEEITSFMKKRYFGLFDVEKPVVQSAASGSFAFPEKVATRVNVISNLIESGSEINNMALLFKRCKNIIEKSDDSIPEKINPDFFEDNEETELFNCIAQTEKFIEKKSDNIEIAREIIKIKPLLDNFFDNVMVMTENPDKRRNRLAMTKKVTEIVREHIGDISYLNI